MKRNKMNFFKSWLLALIINCLIFNCEVITKDKLSDDLDQENEYRNLPSDQDDLNSHETSFLENKLFLLPNKNLSEEGNNTNHEKLNNVNNKPYKIKSNNFVILRRSSFLKNNDQTKEISRSKPVSESTTVNQKKINEINVKDSKEINSTINPQSISTNNYTNNKINFNFSDKIVIEKPNQTILNTNATYLKSNISKTNIDEKNKSVNQETRSLSQIAKEFLLNFYNQVKGVDDTNSNYKEKFIWFNEKIMPYLKSTCVLVFMFIFVYVLFYGINSIGKKNNLPTNDEKNQQNNIKKQDSDKQNNLNINQNKEKVIKMVHNDKKQKKLTLKGRVKKIPSNINYNELFLDTHKFDEKTLHKDRPNNNLDDFFDIVKKNEEINKFTTQTDHKVTSTVKEQMKKESLPKTKEDLLFFDEHETKYNVNNNNEIDFNLEFLKNNKTVKNSLDQNIQDNINKPPIEFYDESVRLINKLKNSGAFKITDLAKEKNMIK